jgi:predicted ATPase
VIAQGPVVGRESELATIRQFVEADASRGGFVLAGQAGIGKTTLWEAALDLARDRGRRVLSARASDAETQLPFSALIDLCDDVPTEALEDLAGPQRSALEVALLRAEPANEAPSMHAIALGFRHVLRALSARTPVLIAIDDVQWLDAPSLDVFAFLARRLEDEPVAFLLTRRAESPARRPASVTTAPRARPTRPSSGRHDRFSLHSRPPTLSSRARRRNRQRR